jgi:hypothetical protein
VTAPHRVGWREPTAAAVTTAAGVIALSWPAVRHPTDWIIGASHNDGNAILWGLHHVARHLSSGRWPPLHTDALFFPDGGTMVVSDLPEMVAVAPVTMAFGAIAAFNLLTILHHALMAAAGWWCVRRHGASRYGAALASVATAFAPVMAGTTFNQNPDVTAWYWVPIVAGLAWRAPSTVAVVMAGALAGLAAWCNPYGGVMAGLAWILLTPMQPLRRWASGLGAMVLVAGSGALLYHHGATAADTLTAKVARDNTWHGVATLPDLVSRWPRILPQDSTWGEAVHAHYPYLGVALMIVGLVSLVRRRDVRWAAVATGAVVLSLGPEIHALGASVPSPVAWLEQLTPLDRLHLSHRYTVLAVFALAFAAAQSMRNWRPRWQIALLIVVAVDFIQPAVSAGLYRPAAPYDDGACALLDGRAPGAVFDVPGERGEQWLYAATCHGRPIAAGLNRSMSPALGVQMKNAAPTDRLSVLRDAGFRYLVVHSRSRRRELERFPGLARLGAACEIARNAAQVRIIDLSDCPAAQ